jgi:inner membrane protein
MGDIETFVGLEGFWIWFILAALLAICEIIVPGIFLIFIAIAAVFTGLLTLIFDFSVPVQFIGFAILSLISVYGGRYFYSKQNVNSSDPLLNNRSARMVGQIVTVTEAVSENGGRVRVGDGEWPARGAVLEVGAKAKVHAVINGTVHIEPV